MLAQQCLSGIASLGTKTTLYMPVSTSVFPLEVYLVEFVKELYSLVGPQVLTIEALQEQDDGHIMQPELTVCDASGLSRPEVIPTLLKDWNPEDTWYLGRLLDPQLGPYTWEPLDVDAELEMSLTSFVTVKRTPPKKRKGYRWGLTVTLDVGALYSAVEAEA